jgi:hypothetical protein
MSLSQEQDLDAKVFLFFAVTDLCQCSVRFWQASETPAEELSVMVDDLINDLSNKFNAVAAEITAKSMCDLAQSQIYM